MNTLKVTIEVRDDEDKVIGFGAAVAPRMPADTLLLPQADKLLTAAVEAMQRDYLVRKHIKEKEERFNYGPGGVATADSTSDRAQQEEETSDDANN